MKKSEDTYELRNKAVDQIIIAFAIIGVLSAALLIRSVVRNPSESSYYVRIGFDALFWTLALLRRHLSLNTKVLSLIILNLLIFIFGLQIMGVLTPIKYRIITIPIILAFVVRPRYAVISLAVFLAVYFLFAWLFVSNHLGYNFDISVTEYVNGGLIWFVDFLTIVVTSIAFIYIGYNYSKSLIEYNKKIKDQNKELVEKERKFRMLFESSNDAIIIFKDLKIVDFNQNTLKLFNCDESYLMSHRLIELTPEILPNGELSANRAKVYYENLMAGTPTVFDWQLLSAKGDIFDVSVSLSLMTIDGENYIQGVLRDITQKKKIEKELELHRNNLEKLVQKKTEDVEIMNEELRATNEELFEKNDIINNQNTELKATLQHLQETQSQLLQSEKMASLGILTAGVAHEINNPLNYIMGAYFGLDNFFKNNESYVEKNIPIFLNSIKEGIDRTSAIVKGLNEFSRSNSGYDENCNIHSIIDNCLVMLHNQLKHSVEIVKDYTEEDIVITGNVGKLHQVFINLFMNAKDAIIGKGTITITTKKSDENITVFIEDDGCGIDEAHLKQVMDPFFTTKPPGKGTGLGLSITYSIISDHKGKISFESEVNKGTKVTIHFPTEGVK